MDELHGEGGSFEVDKATGKRKRVGEKFNEHHPEGDRARDASGKPIDAQPIAPQPSFPAPAAAPWDEPRAEKPKKGAA